MVTGLTVGFLVDGLKVGFLDDGLDVGFLVDGFEVGFFDVGLDVVGVPPPHTQQAILAVSPACEYHISSLSAQEFSMLA